MAAKTLTCGKNFIAVAALKSLVGVNNLTPSALFGNFLLRFGVGFDGHLSERGGILVFHLLNSRQFDFLFCIRLFFLSSQGFQICKFNLCWEDVDKVLYFLLILDPTNGYLQLNIRKFHSHLFFIYFLLFLLVFMDHFFKFLELYLVVVSSGLTGVLRYLSATTLSKALGVRHRYFLAEVRLDIFENFKVLVMGKSDWIHRGLMVF